MFIKLLLLLRLMDGAEMEIMKKKLSFFLFISCGLHLLLLYSFSHSIWLSTSSEIPIQVQEEKTRNPSSQIVDQSIFNHETPKDTPYLSQYNHHTSVEQKGKLVQSPSSGISKFSLAEDTKGNEISIHTDDTSHGVLWSHVDYLENVEAEGIQNRLNTKEIWFYTFNSRVKHQVYWHWVRELKEQLQSAMVSAGSIQNTTFITRIAVLLDERGYLNSVIVRKKSGLDELDHASIQAMKKAHPFPNPPQSLLSEEGLLQLEYTFALTDSQNSSIPSSF